MFQTVQNDIQLKSGVGCSQGDGLRSSKEQLFFLCILRSVGVLLGVDGWYAQRLIKTSDVNTTY